MTKAVIEYDLNDENDRIEFEQAQKAPKTFVALEQIAQEIFRPARKHGYADIEMTRLLEKCGESKDAEGFTTKNGEELIGKLEEKFYEILKDNRIELF